MLRKWKAEDLSQLAAIERATQAVPWSDAIFKDCFHAGYPGWVLEQENKIIGFVIYSIREDESHLLNIGVQPQFQRKGFGRQLLQHILSIIKQESAKIIYLEVRESNQRAIRLYEKMGFMHIGTRQDYYPAFEGRENALIYARDLSDWASSCNYG
ncbi:MAG TPA: ribosomal protein S18-alanine N-acetyltransferase [Gammaproteobacteria bacterium]|nr:ribosomal protein S18-alanine N-acetyltransferase [Gammaproteobacteria bacterium]